ncbi:hypothetical protein C3L33_10359, partial [Rhododendron williamsianum]
MDDSSWLCVQGAYQFADLANEKFKYYIRYKSCGYSSEVSSFGYENVTAVPHAVYHGLEAEGVFYSSGVFTGQLGTDFDHGATAVGYGTATNGTKYWLLIHLLDVSNQQICDQEVQILLVGYIRGLSNEENKAIDIKVLEDRRQDCRSFIIGLPEFTRYTSTQHFPEASFADDHYAASDENKYVFSD